MVIGFTIVLIGIAIVAILLLVKVKKFQHELLAISLIVLILFGVFSFNLAFRGKDISIKDVASLEKAVKIYFSWLGTAASNVKILTAQVVKMNWQGNKTA